MILRLPRSTLTDTLFPYTTLVRSNQVLLLKPQGDEIAVTDENKNEYIHLVTQFHLKVSIALPCVLEIVLNSSTWQVRMGCQAALIQEGLFATMSRECTYLFNERELALLLAGSPQVDVDDWKSHEIGRAHL